MRTLWSRNWVQYAFEAWALGLFMVSASAFGVLLFHPASPVPGLVPNPTARQVLMGIAMGLMAILNVYSPWGRRSGAHLNPAVTLTFWRLGKVAPADAVGYIVFQFVGAVLGMLAATSVLRLWIADPSVNYVVTLPGAGGQVAAFAGEFVISFGLMLMVLVATNTDRIARFTGLFAGVMVALYISLESPISGMSMNPARTLGSAVFAGEWSALWIYFLAPTMAMLSAATVFLRLRGRRAVYCAKLMHDETVRCVFCEFQGR